MVKAKNTDDDYLFVTKKEPMIVDLFVEIRDCFGSMTYFFVLGGDKEWWCVLNEYQITRSDVRLEIDKSLDWYWRHINCIVTQDEGRWRNVPKLLKQLGSYRQEFRQLTK